MGDDTDVDKSTIDTANTKIQTNAKPRTTGDNTDVEKSTTDTTNTKIWNNTEPQTMGDDTDVDKSTTDAAKKQTIHASLMALCQWECLPLEPNCS